MANCRPLVDSGAVAGQHSSYGKTAVVTSLRRPIRGVSCFSDPALFAQGSQRSLLHQRTITPGHSRRASSAVTSVADSAIAWAAIIRSKGSLFCHSRKRHVPAACFVEIGSRVAPSRSTYDSSTSGGTPSSHRMCFPLAALMVISQMEAALTSKWLSSDSRCPAQRSGKRQRSRPPTGERVE